MMGLETRIGIDHFIINSMVGWLIGRLSARRGWQIWQGMVVALALAVFVIVVL